MKILTRVILPAVFVLFTLAVVFIFAQDSDESLYEEEIIHIAGGLEFRVLVNNRTGKVDYVWSDSKKSPNKWERPANQSYWQKLFEAEMRSREYKSVEEQKK